MTVRPVYIVHCIDTEGPLHESLTATFERLRDIFHLDLEPSEFTLRQLQNGMLDLNGLEASVQRVVDPHLLAYNNTWDKVDAMLTRIMEESFRNKMPDSAGRGWVFNWFCVDHVDYDANPRRRDMGYHNVFEHYSWILKQNSENRDGLHFHYHPHSFSREAHRSATHWWAASDSLHQVISRRVIDHMWFPAAHRPGFHVIRPDSHWFLEQHIPFDFSNQSIAQAGTDAQQFGVAGGRFGDWRRAPATWQPYHPAADDYQVPGSSRRWIARCLNVGTRYRVIREQDIRQAFEEAAAGKPVVLSITNHDFRDMAPDVEGFRELLEKVVRDFPQVPFFYSEALAAMRSALELPVQPPCELECRLERVGDSAAVLTVSSMTPTFGPQPWLALKTVNGKYHFDNFDIDVPFHRWQYVFDQETFALSGLSVIGIAANNAQGSTTVVQVDPVSGMTKTRQWNVPSQIPAETTASL
jgi:hypothetical protein